MKQPAPHPQCQGIALVTSLVFLLVLTLLATGAMRETTLQERMAGNLRDRNLALQAAEAALREAENWVGSTDGRQAAAALAAELADGHAWDGANPPPTRPALPGFTDGGLHAAAPAFHVSPPRSLRGTGGSVEIGVEVPSTFTTHEVTARGVGARDTTVAILQTTVMLP